MKYSVAWLNELAGTHLSGEEMAELFTKHSFEVDGLEQGRVIPEGVVVGKILEVMSHPDADNLQIARVTIDPEEKEILEIVCGAKNIAVGDYVPVATVGTKLAKDFVIKKAKIRGVESFGMLCAEDELGLGDDHLGILQLEKNIPLGSRVEEIIGKDEGSIDLDILASRGTDALSHRGIARELCAIVEKECNFASPSREKSQNEESKSIQVRIENEEVCHRYTGVLLEGLDNTEPSPDWMVDRLRSCGLRSVNLATDITNYVMLETGQPLHAFDADVSGTDIYVRQAKPGESLELLDGKEITLDEKDMVIANESEILALAGVMGGELSGTSEKTSRIFLEGAWFDPVSIRKTRIRHKLQTESAYRFERNVDENGISLAIDRALELFQEKGKASVREERDVYPHPCTPWEIQLSHQDVTALLGKEISQDKIQEILESLDFQVKREDASFLVTVPTQRKDVHSSQDLIEEIGRLYGYQNIEPRVLTAPLRVTEKSTYRQGKRRIEDILVGCGYDEIMTYSFYGENMVSLFDLERDRQFTLMNPLNPDQKFFRSRILPNMLTGVRENLKQFDEVRVFEIGNIYERGEDGSVKEYKRLGLISSTTKRQDCLFSLKGTVQSLVESLFYEPAEFSPLYEEEKTECFHPTQSMDIVVDGVLIGFIGTLHPFFTQALKLPHQTAVASLNIDALTQLLENDERVYQPINRFPTVSRDISLAVSQKVTVAEIEEIIRGVAQEKLHSMELFDIFEKEDEKKYAYHLAFISPDRTLSGEEVDTLRDAIFDTLEEKIGAKIAR